MNKNPGKEEITEDSDDNDSEFEEEEESEQLEQEEEEEEQAEEEIPEEEEEPVEEPSDEDVVEVFQSSEAEAEEEERLRKELELFEGEGAEEEGEEFAVEEEKAEEQELELIEEEEEELKKGGEKPEIDLEKRDTEEEREEEEEERLDQLNEFDKGFINDVLLSEEEYEKEIGNPLIDETEHLSSKKKKEIKKPYKKINKSYKSFLSYKSKNPQPNYTKFGLPQFVDEHGREYKICTNIEFSNQLIDYNFFSRPKNYPKRRDISESKKQFWGNQVFWMRVRKGDLYTIGFPQLDERLTFYDPKTQVIATGKISFLHRYERSATGYTVLKDFCTYGSTNDPSQFEYLTDKNIKIKRNKDLF